ncbi:hypothetical protein Mal4_44570 [Maioricimonas rarisocia]|uniref:Uncharacterized protein n=1 Tax=Maioricimonas rarisocia TaxID=2528026 RepID=A0A517ZC78_9PLAN|nr:hypothetical protein Mal4_44570 [Maioricimonas rarisocia]
MLLPQASRLEPSEPRPSRRCAPLQGVPPRSIFIGDTEGFGGRSWSEQRKRFHGGARGTCLPGEPNDTTAWEVLWIVWTR